MVTIPFITGNGVYVHSKGKSNFMNQVALLGRLKHDSTLGIVERRESCRLTHVFIIDHFDFFLVISLLTCNSRIYIIRNENWRKNLAGTIHSIWNDRVSQYRVRMIIRKIISI